MVTRLQVTGVKGIGAILTSFAMYMMHIINEAIIVLVFIMFVDVASGLMRAFLTKSLNSTVGWAGAIKKFSALLLIGVAGSIEFMVISAGQDPKGFIVLGVTSFFIVNETLSILENFAQIGLPIPPILYNVLEKLHKDPLGKEQRVERDPTLDRIDKLKLMQENQILHQEIVKNKSENKEEKT